MNENENSVSNVDESKDKMKLPSFAMAGDLFNDIAAGLTNNDKQEHICSGSDTDDNNDSTSSDDGHEDEQHDEHH